MGGGILASCGETSAGECERDRATSIAAGKIGVILLVEIGTVVESLRGRRDTPFLQEEGHAAEVAFNACSEINGPS